MLKLIEDSLLREEILDVYSLKRQGYSQRRIAREPGVHRKTVKKYLEDSDRLQHRTNYKRASKLDPFIRNIEAWLDDDILHQATWIYDHLLPPVCINKVVAFFVKNVSFSGRI